MIRLGVSEDASGMERWGSPADGLALMIRDECLVFKQRIVTLVLLWYSVVTHKWIKQLRHFFEPFNSLFTIRKLFACHCLWFWSFVHKLAFSIIMANHLP